MYDADACVSLCLNAAELLLQDWCNLTSAISDQKLKQPLMSQDPQGTVLRVNFDAALVRLLREVRYFLLLPDLPIEIPANALKVNLNCQKRASSSLAKYHSILS